MSFFDTNLDVSNKPNGKPSHPLQTQNIYKYYLYILMGNSSSTTSNYTSSSTPTTSNCEGNNSNYHRSRGQIISFGNNSQEKLSQHEEVC